jgi:hypothetical protein
MTGSINQSQIIEDEDVQVLIEDSLALKLQQDSRLTMARTKCERCYWACMILREETYPPVPYRLIAKVFDTDYVSIRRYYKEFQMYQDMLILPGRPSLLNETQLNDVIEFIMNAYTNRNPITTKAIQGFIHDQFGLFIVNNTLHHMLSKLDCLKSVVGLPMEEKRVSVKQEDIIHYFAYIIQHLNGTPAHFIFNMDEMGHQEFVDAGSKIVFVPSDYPNASIYYPVPRTGRRITLIAAIALDGSYIKPMMIISRKTIDDDLPLLGITAEKVVIVHQPKGFIETFIFERWFEEIFLPELEARRSAFQYTGPAFLILDGCICHHSPKVDTLCDVHYVHLIFLPAHSSNQTQPLDLSIFGITKSTLNRVNRIDSVNIQSCHIAAILSAFQIAATTPNIVESFANAGITIVRHNDPVIQIVCKVDPSRARCLLVPLVASPIGEVFENPDEEDHDEDYEFAESNDEEDSQEGDSEDESEDIPLYIKCFRKHFGFSQ